MLIQSQKIPEGFADWIRAVPRVQLGLEQPDAFDCPVVKDREEFMSSTLAANDVLKGQCAQRL